MKERSVLVVLFILMVELGEKGEEEGGIKKKLDQLSLIRKKYIVKKKKGFSWVLCLIEVISFL